MAALVKSVYRMEKDRASGLWKCPSNDPSHTSSTTIWWHAFHYDLLYPLVEENGTGTVFGAVFHSRLNHNLGCLGAPRIVVAFRGTLLRKLDLDADLSILFHHLCSHKRFDLALHIVRQEVARHGQQSVCLTGHSKGAALGLLVGRRLAEEGCFLEAHLFNPPHPSLPTATMSIPDKITTAAHVCHNVLANGLAHVLQDEKTRTHDRDTFQAIIPWLPHLYLNVHDPICSSYIRYFEAHRHMPNLKGRWFGFAISSTPRSIRAVLRSSMSGADAKPDHLIPSAYLHVNEIPSTLRESHQLQQWYNLDIRLLPVKTVFDPVGDCMIRGDPK